MGVMQANEQRQDAPSITRAPQPRTPAQTARATRLDTIGSYALLVGWLIAPPLLFGALAYNFITALVAQH